MLKTCGQTRLLEAIKPLLQLAVEMGFDAEDATLFYSRKDYLYPALQKYPQGHIHQEFDFLDNMHDGND